ncbi:MAG: hypothetical protein KGS61_20435 [Verrucomicrobia bacterium]|nr:hypothetical protein [Verrucomicrobiota bacterium]
MKAEDETLEVTTVELADDLCSHAWRPPERFKHAQCTECNAPLSTYNPNTICEPCREKLKRQLLPRDQHLPVEHYWTGYLVKLRRREPIAH